MSVYHTGPISSYVAPAQPAQSFQLADVLRLVHARRSLILRITVCVIGLTLLVVLALPNTYATSASIVLEQRKNSVTDLSSVIQPLTIDPATLQNQIQILTSRDLAAQVIADLKLYDDAEFNPATGSNPILALKSALNPRNWFAAAKPASVAAQERLRDDIVSEFLDHLSVGAEGLSTTLTIAFSSRDPEKASRIANSIAENYVNNQITTKVDAAQSTASWLTQRVHELSQQIQVEEEAIQKYKAENNLADTNTGLQGAPTPLVDQQIAAISTQLLQSKTDLAEKEAIYNRVDLLVKSGNVGDVSTVVSSPLISQLRSQQATLISQAADLSTRYGPLHPSLQAIETQKRELDSKIAQEAIRVASSASNDVVVARAHVKALQDALNQSENKADSQNMARVKLKALEANESSTRTTYEAFVSRLRGIQNQDTVQIAEARIISRAPIPDSPAAPKRALIVGASLPVGLLVALLVVLFLERFGFSAATPNSRQPQINLATPAFGSNSMRSAFSPSPAHRSYAGPPVIAHIPNATAPGAADFIVDWPQSAFSHAIVGLVGHLSQSRFVVIATPEPGTGGSIVAAALARAAAMMGRKVLLIEADGQAHAAKIMRLAPPAGLADVLLNRVAFPHAIAKDPRSNAFVLGNARAPRNVSSMFASTQMAAFANYLRTACDLVIIDAGSLSGGGAAATSHQADITLVVGTPDSLRRTETMQALAPLGQSTAIGIVVTH